jgi:hypothetical protein
MRGKWADALGFSLVATIMMLPLMALAWLGDQTLLRPRVGPKALIIPAAVGLGAAVLCSSILYWATRNKPRDPSHAGIAVMISVFLCLSFCGWGEWAINAFKRAPLPSYFDMPVDEKEVPKKENDK